MRHVSIICPWCKELVSVVDKHLAQHNDAGGIHCGNSGMTYVPSPRFSLGNGLAVEVVSVRSTTVPCETHGSHPALEVVGRLHADSDSTSVGAKEWVN